MLEMNVGALLSINFCFFEKLNLCHFFFHLNFYKIEVKT